MSYEKFAQVYDIMMADTPYENWADYIEQLFKKFESSPKLILDLGCGTGTISAIFSSKGYDMIGIDSSLDMLMIAREKSEKLGKKVLYLNQDMTDFELYGTVDCILCLCDSLNYITEEEELGKVFALVNNYLDPGGLFIFDINTTYKFREVLSDNTFAGVYDNCAYIWDNYFYEKENMNEYKLTLFIDENGSYRRYEEQHYEKAYSIETIQRLIEEAGLKLEGIYDELSFGFPREESERIYFVVREKMKQRSNENE